MKNRTLKSAQQFIWIVALCLGVSQSVFAKDNDHPKEPKEPPHTVCFNLFCTYETAVRTDDQPESSGGYRKCEAAARFTKKVHWDGNEIWDDSEHPDNPEFQVSCDDEILFNGSAHRYTDYQGTRLQAVIGPYPALLLPRGALRDRHGYVVSALELRNQTLKGLCYLYTGPQ